MASRPSVENLIRPPQSLQLAGTASHSQVKIKWSLQQQQVLTRSTYQLTGQGPQLRQTATALSPQQPVSRSHKQL